MPREKLEHAIGAIRVRFGDQALIRGTRLATAVPWPSGQPAIDRLSGIGGLPRGRVSVLQGAEGSGKTSLGQALLAQATREHANAVVIDRRNERFDPWIPDLLGADLDVLTVVRPPTAAIAGEAAVSLASPGTGFLLVLSELPDADLARLESVVARSGSLVVAVPGGVQRALAHTSSLTLELERVAWVWEHGLIVGVRSVVRCIKNKLATPGAEVELVMRYPVGPRLPKIAPPVEVEREMGEGWAATSAG
jgi:recombination protein RecA